MEKNYVNLTMLEKSLWWCLTIEDSEEAMVLSPPLQAILEKESLRYDDFLDFLLPDSANLFAYKVKDFCSGGTGSRFLMGMEFDGKVRWFMNDMQLDSQEDNVVVFATCIEVSEMYALEEKLVEYHSQLVIEKLQAEEEQAKKEAEILQKQYNEQTQFLAMLSHELRSPLMGVNSLIGMVKRQYADGLDINDPLRLMRLTVDQLNFLINDILTYSQTQFNHIQLNPTTFSLEEMAEYVSHLTKSIAKEKGVFVSVSLHCENSCFYGDLVRISQILVNLIVNGIKFTHFGGVFVEIKQQDDTIEFIVSDSGEGISPENLNTIFEPFKQLDSEGSKQYVGSGLGLSIVKTLVDMMDGRIRVESTIGIGTAFIVELPMKPTPCDDVLKCPAESGWEDENLVSGVAESGYRVLIADDSAINRKVLEFFLLEAGCQVDQASDGEEAWCLFEKNQYDYVFLDIQMPIMNGVEICQKIRQQPMDSRSGLKGVFALTAAHTEAELAQMGISIDKSIFDEWMEKPVSQDKVIRLLHQEPLDRNHAAKEPSDALNLKEKLPEALHSLIPQFFETTSEELRLAKTSLEHQDMQKLKEQLHSLKGNLMLFELSEMVELIKQIESINDFENISVLNELFSQLQKKFKGLY